MNYNASDYVFKAPPVISRARRVLIKPAISYPAAYPVTTNPEMISQIIQGIRQVSDADILILGGTPTGAPIQPIYQKLGYEVFATLDYPPEHQRYFLRKRLVEAG